MSRFEAIAQAARQRLSASLRTARGWDRHRMAHLALAAVHAVTGCILAAGSAMPEAVCAWASALIYLGLGGSPPHRG